MIWFKKIYCCFPNLPSVLVVLFAFQITIISVSASPSILYQNHHTVILETYTHDGIKNSVWAESGLTSGLSRVLSEKEVRPDHEVLACVARDAARGATTYTKSSLALGRQVHSGYKVAEHAPALGRFKEFTGIKGIRPDFVDFGTKTIYELKPFNPRGIQLGTKQLNNYKSIFEQNYGGTWKTVLDFY